MLFNRIMYVLLLLIAIIFNIFFDGYLALFFIAFVILLPILSLLLLFFLRNQLKLNISTLTPTNIRGEKSSVRITAFTKYKFLSSKVRIRIKTKNTFTNDESRDYIYISPSFDTHNIDLFFSSKHSGSLLFKIDEVRIYDFLMLFSIKNKLNTNNSCIVTVLPKGINSEIPTSVESSIAGESNEYSKKIAGDDPSEVFDIREYRDGDRIRRIHRWLSEKHNSIIVKDFGEPISTNVLVLVDFSENLELSENILNLLYSIIDNLLKNEIKSSVKWYNHIKKQINEFSSNEEFNIPFFFSLLLESSKCEYGLLDNYFIKDDIGKYSNIIYICSNIKKEMASNLYEMSQLVNLAIYEITNQNTNKLEKIRDIPVEYHQIMV